MATRSLGLKSSDSWEKQITWPLISVSKDFMSYTKEKQNKTKNNHRGKKPTKKSKKEKWEVILSLKGGRRILLVNPNPDAGTKIEKSHSPLALPKPSRDSNTNFQGCFNWRGFCKEVPVCSFGLGMLIRKINFLKESRRKEFKGWISVPSSQLDTAMRGNSHRRRYQAFPSWCSPSKMTVFGSMKTVPLLPAKPRKSKTCWKKHVFCSC